LSLVAGAWRLVYLYRLVARVGVVARMVARRPPRDLAALGVVGDVVEGLLEWHRRYGEPVARAASLLVSRAIAEGMLHVAFYTDVPGLARAAAVALVASPPEVTHKPYAAVTPTSYITCHFIPCRIGGRLHRNTLARFFYGLVSATRPQFLRYVSGNPALRRVYERSLGRYLDRGYPEGRAKRLAFRDALRVVIGSAWLVRTLQLLDRGDLRPGDVVLPRREMLEKVYTGELVDPAQVVPPERRGRWLGYTWRRLLETVARA
jgi:hypothetical protein